MTPKKQFSNGLYNKDKWRNCRMEKVEWRFSQLSIIYKELKNDVGYRFLKNRYLTYIKSL